MPKAIDTIAKVLGIKPKDLNDAIEKDEDIQLSGTFFSDSDLESSNKKITESARKTAFDEVGKAIGVDFKDLESFKTGIASKFSDEDSKTEIKKLSDSLAEKNTLLEATTGKYESALKKNKDLTISTTIGSMIPENKLGRKRIETLYRTENNVAVGDDGSVFLADKEGNPLLDKKQKPIDIKAHVADYVAQLNIEGGREKDTTPSRNNDPEGGGKYGHVNNFQDFLKYAKAQGIDAGSPAGTKLLSDIIKNNKNYVKQ